VTARYVNHPTRLIEIGVVDRWHFVLEFFAHHSALIVAQQSKVDGLQDEWCTVKVLGTDGRAVARMRGMNVVRRL